MKTSQKMIVLSMLTHGPVCGTTLLDLHIPRYADRVYTLKSDGWIIDTRTCEQHDYHTTRQIEYVLVNQTQVPMSPDTVKYVKPPLAPPGTLW